MTHIKIKKGLDIPLSGKPYGNISPLMLSEQVGLNLSGFEEIKFRLLVNVGDLVKLGQPLLEDKSNPQRVFISPAGGVIKEIRRGLKRALEMIVIDVDKQEENVQFPIVDPKQTQKETLLEIMLKGGSFTRIHQRPFNRLADPNKTPRSIFVKAIESAPYTPSAEMQVEGYEKEFQAGLCALSKLTSGQVHLTYHKNTTCKAFSEALFVQKHTAEGPHPIGTHSLHIQEIDPILTANDLIWTLSALDVVSIGFLLTKGISFHERVISIAGGGILTDRTGFFKGRDGQSIASLISGRLQKGLLRLISGDPLMGVKVSAEDYLGFNHTVFCVIPENIKRSFLHFFRLGLEKYSFSRAYLSGHLNKTKLEFDFTTSQHGEHRAFIDSSLYDKVMPLSIPTMLLVKAVMAEDFELAEILGLLQVDTEDFALPTFVCPSKIEMTEIIKAGLKKYAIEFTV